MPTTILIVDDKLSLQALVRDYLMVTADNGRDALFVARQAKPDLIILDIMMPESSFTACAI